MTLILVGTSLNSGSCKKRKEADHGKKIMRKSALYVSRRAREGVLFVRLPGSKDRYSLSLYTFGLPT